MLFPKPDVFSPNKNKNKNKKQRTINKTNKQILLTRTIGNYNYILTTIS